MGYKRDLDCQYGKLYYGKKEDLTGREKKKLPRLRTQGTRKQGCKACIFIREYVIFPDYGIDNEVARKLSNWKLRQLKEEKLKVLRCDIKRGVTKGTHKYYISLPTNEAHHSTHPTGGIYGMAQKVHPKLIEKVHQLVSEGVTNVSEMKRALDHYVKHDLCRSSPPDIDDRAYHPSTRDIKNHIYCAKSKIQLSKIDQENLRLKINQWRVTSPSTMFYYRPFKKKAAEDVITMVNETQLDDEIEIDEFEQSLLYVHQEKWQQDLLLKYGNTISLMDATYKTTKYELPLFFICVKTNVGYSIVADFIVQFETSSHIEEALKILKKWNPSWHPPHFMSDYSEAEISALQVSFPSVKVYLCDFHREQAWERWVKDQKHGVSKEEADILLEILRACAWAPPAEDHERLPFDCHFKAAINTLKESSIWVSNPQVKAWLLSKWLSKPQVR